MVGAGNGIFKTRGMASKYSDAGFCLMQMHSSETTAEASSRFTLIWIEAVVSTNLDLFFLESLQ